MEELDKGEKGIGDGMISYGLAQGTAFFIVAEDMSLTHWNGTIIGPPNVHSFIYFRPSFKTESIAWKLYVGLSTLKKVQMLVLKPKLICHLSMPKEKFKISLCFKTGKTLIQCKIS